MPWLGLYNAPLVVQTAATVTATTLQAVETVGQVGVKVGTLGAVSTGSNSKKKKKEAAKQRLAEAKSKKVRVDP